jgi:quercetin dioxygenase-like cupin family protein
MFVSHRDVIEKKVLSGSALKHVSKQVLIGPDQGWSDHVMRFFSVGKDGCTPRHSHDWPHIIYVVEGEGVLFIDGEEHSLSPGSVVFVPNRSEHQLTHSGGSDADFCFICIVPEYGDS